MKKILLYLFVPFIFAACSGKQGKQGDTQSGIALKATPDTVMTALFKRTCCGFTGGDGTYSVRLPDGRTLWIFGDTFVGRVYPDNTRERRNPIYIRNSFVIQDGDSLQTLYHHVNGKDASEIIFPYKDKNPASFREDSAWFWPGDGLIENGKLKVFLSEFTQVDTGMWGFKWMGTWIASYSLPGVVRDSLYRIPYSQVNQVHYGHAVCETRKYTYIYGAGNGKPYVARYPAGDVNRPWTFFNGEDWVDNPAQSRPMDDINISEQFSISRIKDKYVLVTQEGFLSNEIYSYTSEKPYGPWENRKMIYKIPVPEGSKTIFTYNALAHPEFINKEGLLVSYNTNSFELEEHFRDANIYRPRFIRVPLKLIDPGL